MSKKWKNKLKKQQKAQIVREMMQAGEQTTTTTTSPITQPDNISSSPEPKNFKKLQVDSVAEKSLLPEIARVKHDIRKIGYISAAILVILVAVAITDQKTGWILEVANWLFGRLKV